MLNLIKPNIKTELIKQDENYAEIQISPLERGYATTFGNSLRRVLLSSIPGNAIVSIKIKDVLHEFSTIPKVREDVMEIILNLKKLSFNFEGEKIEATIDVSGEKKVTAGDIQFQGNASAVDKSAYIASVEKGGNLKIDLVIKSGWGYVPAETNKKEIKEISTIAIDSIYTPIRLANFKVENMRVGNRTDYDKLTMMIKTDGSITPKEALSVASKIMLEHLSVLVKESEKSEDIEVFSDETENVAKKHTILKETDEVDMLDISERALNGLKRAGIQTIAELSRKTKEELGEIENIGTMTVDEIEKKLVAIGYKLKDTN